MGIARHTAGHIKIEDWQRCLKAKIAGRQCDDRGTEPYSLDKKPNAVKLRNLWYNIYGNLLTIEDKPMKPTEQYLPASIITCLLQNFCMRPTSLPHIALTTKRLLVSGFSPFRFWFRFC
ncbi:MAG: hypothetical protein ACRESZ_07275, partial [Methylococcales bacterium]